MGKTANISLYWKCQLIGWSLAAGYWGVIGYTAPRFSWPLAFIHFAADLLMYIPLTHLFRNFSVRMGWHKLDTRPLMIRVIVSVVVLGSLFMMLTITKNFLIKYAFEEDFSDTFRTYLKNAWLVTFATGIRLMSIWVLAYYGYHFAQREINAVKESSRLAMIAKDVKFDNLSAQLNPHFFFNSLNSIKALVLEDPLAARRAIDLLSELLRTSLSVRDNSLISLDTELALINDYLELEKIRFEEKLEVKLIAADNIQQTLVLPLMVQLLVENAIKHGIASSKPGGELFIHIEKKNGNLYTEVRNPGKLKANFSYGVGLSNLTERLKLQYPEKAWFNLKQLNDETVSASLITPLS